MPMFQAMSERANARFNRERIHEVDAAHLGFDAARNVVAGGVTLAALATKLDIAITEAEKKHLETWPPALQEALRAALLSALNRTPRLPVTISWAPGYDYELQIWEARSAGTSRAAMTILLRSRYPDA